MAKPASRPYTPYAIEAARLLGLLVRNERIARKMPAADLAERAGISRGLLTRIEEGDMGCAIGAVFEVASLLCIPLFEADPKTLPKLVAMAAEKTALLPKAARRSVRKVNDDF